MHNKLYCPILKVVNQNFGIVNGLMSTIHAITSSQSSIDEA